MEWRDEIVDEVRRAREEYAARFDFDIDRMFEDIKKREARHPGALAKLQPCEPSPFPDAAEHGPK